MTTQEMIEDGWTPTEDGRGWISPVKYPSPRSNKHDARAWGYADPETGRERFAAACTGCGFNLVDLDSLTDAEYHADYHWREDYERPPEILWTSKGHEVEVAMSDEEAAEALREKAETGNDFARDLADGFAKYGSWTDGQRPWAHLLANEQRAKAAPTPEAEEEANEGPAFPRIVAMMAEAAESLKYPKVRLADADDNVVRLSVAGGRARYPGSVNVTTDESYHDNTWYGRIMTDGTWAPSKSVPSWVADALAEFEADPEGAARAYGQRFSSCCFCGRELTADGSIDVGYGPICADNFGLPHPQY